jgi:hypothetical protein
MLKQQSLLSKPPCLIESKLEESFCFCKLWGAAYATAVFVKVPNSLASEMLHVWEDWI